MPDDIKPIDQIKSVFDEIDDEIEAKAIAEAEADIAAGRLISHEKVVEWLRSLGKPNELPMPEPDVQ